MPPDVAAVIRPTRSAFRVPPSAFLAAAALLLLVSVIVTTVQNLDSPWTSVRLAPTFALLRGDPLYSLPSQPPWVMVGYGPLYPWLYLPCVLARGPVAAVTIGTILAHLFILVPVALLCRALAGRLAAADPRDRPPAVGAVLPGLLFFGVLMCLVGSVESVARHVHVDAPTYGLLLLACYAALRAEPPASTFSVLGWIVAAGVLAGMCVCCKSNALGSVGGLGLYVGWALGWRRLAAFVLGAAAVVALVYGWAVWQSGGAAILHNFRTLGRFPWHKFQAIEFNNWSYGECSRDPREKLFAAGYLSLQAIQTYAIPFGVMALAAYGLGRRAPDATAATAINPFPGPGRIIGCLLWVTLLGAPAAIVSTAKYGGEVNSWAFIGVPLTAAAVLMAVALLDRATATERLAAHGVLGAMGLVVLLGSALVFQRLDPRGGTSMGEAYRAIKSHPGLCYFPSDPLDHLLAGDRFRPNLDTVYSYWVGESPIDPAVFKTAMPAGLEYVAVSRKMEGWGGDEVHRLLPEESAPTDRLGLKFHDVWTKP